MTRIEFVTGAPPNGTGLASARAFLQAGHQIVLTDMDGDAVSKIATAFVSGAVFTGFVKTPMQERETM